MNKIIGLTGSIAAGKDEVVKILKRRGAEIIDADKIAHSLYLPQSAVWRDLVKTFGSKILNRGGVINRKKLGEIVFADPKRLLQLNSIVHPALKEEIIKKIESGRQAVKSGGKMVVINAAVLKEIGLVDRVDEVWVVLAAKEQRRRRLVKKGLTKKEAGKMLKVQAPQKEYLSGADVVIKNNSSIAALKKQVLKLLK